MIPIKNINPVFRQRRKIGGFMLAAFCLTAVTLTSCRKYAETAATIGGSPAYLRVFNVVPFTLTPINSSGNLPFFTFLMDPKPDATGIPDGGAIVGDYLGTRQIFCTSNAVNEGNSLGASLDTAVKTDINYEYPGAAHVLTAPPINGYDLSAWAQVPSGKHRVLFISRPQTNTPFDSLSSTIRNNIVIDTTIDLQAGEVYTLEAVSTNEDLNAYGAYLRQEQFPHQTFSDSNIYVCFYNLSGVPSAYSNNQYAPTFGDYGDSLQITCTYNILDDIEYQQEQEYSYYPLVGFNRTPIAVVNQTMTPTAAWSPIPVLPNSYYFDPQGLFRLYESTPTAQYGNGSLPWVSFYVTNTNTGVGSGAQHLLNCYDNPAQINGVQRSLLSPTVGPYTQQDMASLSLFSNFSGSMQAYPCLNILEIAYNTVYCMQIQPAFYNPTN